MVAEVYILVRQQGVFSLEYHWDPWTAFHGFHCIWHIRVLFHGTCIIASKESKVSFRTPNSFNR